MYDLHVHSIFSNDAYPTATMENICNKAICMGLKGICFTDHVDIDYPSDDELFDFDDYCKSLNEISARFNNKLSVLKGVELGLQPHLFEQNKRISSKPNIDFVLGSIHVVNKKELYKGDFLGNDSDHKGILNYFNDLKKCLLSFDDFDSLGHIDVVRRYLNSGEKEFSYIKYKDELNHILKTLVHMGKGLELNTSGIRYGLSDFHPLTDILELYKKLGGEIITIGSDAHRPEDLGYEFSKVSLLLKQLGYKYYCIFEKRKPIFIKID